MRKTNGENVTNFTIFETIFFTSFKLCQFSSLICRHLQSFTQGVKLGEGALMVISRCRHWLVMDGPVDPTWMDALNTAVDESHCLQLPSGERVPGGLNTRLILETADLTHISPTTVGTNLAVPAKTIPFKPPNPVIKCEHNDANLFRRVVASSCTSRITPLNGHAWSAAGCATNRPPSPFTSAISKRQQRVSAIHCCTLWTAFVVERVYVWNAAKTRICSWYNTTTVCRKCVIKSEIVVFKSGFRRWKKTLGFTTIGIWEPNSK